MARTVGELIALRGRVNALDTGSLRTLLSEMIDELMDAQHALRMARGNADAVARVSALRDRLMSARTRDPASLVHGAEIASALTGRDVSITIPVSGEGA